MKRYIILLFTIHCSLFTVHCQTWYPTGNEVSYYVESMEIYSEELYVSGCFDSIGNIEVNYIARWNGSNWNSVDQGLKFGYAKCMTEYNGELIIAGGNIHIEGEDSIGAIARWNGTQWNSVGGGVASTIWDMAVYKGDLYVGGNTTYAGGIDVNRIAKWNDSVWSGVGGGVTSGFGLVNALATYKDELYVGGDFYFAGGDTTIHIARWDNGSWADVDTGSSGRIEVLLEDTINDVLYASGAYAKIGGDNGVLANKIAMWNSSEWEALGDGISGGIYAMTMYHNELYVGGMMLIVGSDSTTIAVARWDGSQWHEVIGPNNTVSCLQVYNDTLYVGGYFTEVDGKDSKYLARYYSPIITTEEEKTIKKKEDKEYLGNCVPNPLSNTTVINYNLPKNSKKASLQINTLSGKTVKSIPLQLNNSSITLSLQELPIGTYLYSLYGDGELLGTKKMVVVD